MLDGAVKMCGIPIYMYLYTSANFVEGGVAGVETPFKEVFDTLLEEMLEEVLFGEQMCLYKHTCTSLRRERG